MKKYLFIAASALALASCSSEDFVGTEGGNVETSANKAINFAGETGKTTRAANGNKVGADAATLLGNKFYVLGTKGTLPTGSPTTTKVFDNYQVEWGANTAGTSSDNTNDWKYAGLDFVALNKTSHNEGDKQTIKYWDYSQPQYDFIAYSIGNNTLVTDKTATLNDNEVLGTTIVTPNENNNSTYTSYSLKATKINDLKECYYTDVTTVVKDNYGKPVQFTFKNLTAKVRVAFYETVPGYSVKDLRFYSDENTGRTDLATEDSKKATLYATGTESYIAKNGEITVTYPVVGKTASDYNTKGYNKAIVSVTPATDDKISKLDLGTVNYNTEFLAKTAKEATMAGKKADSYYTAVLPIAAEGKPLTLRMNYTLVSDDGSKEEIKVYGAKAVIPASYTQWQPNFAYTYIFKISDNTNGATSTDTNTPEGLFPITFDAVVADIDNVDFNQETITTVSTPSVTSYAFDTNKKEVIMAYGNGNEYPAAATTDIYVSVTATKASDDGTINVGTPKSDLNDATKSQLYTIDTNHTNATEAEVIDALQVQSSKTETSITGRNGVTLTNVAENVVSYPETIPSADNKTITVIANSVAKFTATATATTYAYVYKEKDGTAKDIITAVKGDGSITAGENEYYTDYECTQPVAKDTQLANNKIYYKKYSNNNNVYAVKVIKTFVAQTQP